MAHGVDAVDAAMALVAPLGVTLELSDKDKKYPGAAQWAGGETFTVSAAMAVSGAFLVIIMRRGEMLVEFEVGVQGYFGASLGDTFTLEGSGHAIAANIYELIERGIFLNEPS